jgi:hypothetical protein
MLANHRKLTAVLLCVAWTGCGLLPAHSAEESTPAEAVLQAWADLGAADEAKAVRAILTLGTKPQDALELLKANLPPVKADSQRVARLIADLDHDKFTVRQRAAEDLEYLGKFIKEDLEKAIAANPALEVKQRLQMLLDKLPDPKKDMKAQPNINNARSISVSNVNGQVRIVVDGVPLDLTPRVIAPVGPPMVWVRAVRAIGLLEHMNTTESRQLLESLANGESDALPTKAAKEALERLNKK